MTGCLLRCTLTSLPPAATSSPKSAPSRLDTYALYCHPRGMIELLPESIRDIFTNSISFYNRGWINDSTGSGLLSPGDLPRARRVGHKRHLSLSVFSPRKGLWTAAAIAFLTALGLWWSFGPISRLQIQVPDVEDAGPTFPLIPLGESRDRGGREVFWWEQFPR